MDIAFTKQLERPITEEAGRLNKRGARDIYSQGDNDHLKTSTHFMPVRFIFATVGHSTQ